MTNIVVGKDRISLVESERYVAGTKNVYLMKISFSEDWKGLEKHVVFRTDNFDITLEVLGTTEQFPIPSQIFAKPTNKLQVGVYGSKCDEKVLNTRWLSLGRVVKGTFENDCCCGSKPSTMPSPDTYRVLRELIDGKADRLTFEDGQLILWAGDQPLSSFELEIPESTSEVVLTAPLGAILAWSGTTDQLPPGYSLCDGQNGTVDLRNAFIMGASNTLKPGPYSKNELAQTPVPLNLAPGMIQPGITPASTVHVYALAFIQKTSLTSFDKKQGQSAYEVAVENGFNGTEAEWLKSLKGSNGLSAYQIAVDNDFNGSETEWLKSLKGSNGLSAYEVAKLDGFPGSEAEWLESLKGPQGEQGVPGKSAYQIAVDNGFQGSEDEWIKKLESNQVLPVILDTTITNKDFTSDGSGDYIFKNVTLAVASKKLRTSSVFFDRAIMHVEFDESNQITFTSLDNTTYLAKLDESGNITEIGQITVDSDGTTGIEGPKGDKGDDGKSAYQIAVDNGFVGDEKQWLESLKGPKGDDGKDGQPGEQGTPGKSAYEIAKEHNPELTNEQQWLESLKGPKGDDGKDGQPGENGVAGKSAYEIAKEHNPSLNSEEEWLESLKGAPGEQGPAGQNGSDGKDGAPGKSAYEIALEHDFHGSEEDWLASLVGEPGEDGKSVQTIQEYSTEKDIIVGRWYDNKPVKRKLIELNSVEVETSGAKVIAKLPQDLTIVSLSAVATFHDGDVVPSGASGKFISPLPAVCDDIWFSIRYYPEEENQNLYLVANGVVSSTVTLDLRLTIESVNPQDEDLSDDDLIVDIPSTEPGTGTTDHRALTHRDADEQHPISAITGLNTTLSSMPSETITKEEINDLFN